MSQRITIVANITASICCTITHSGILWVCCLYNIWIGCCCNKQGNSWLSRRDTADAGLERFQPTPFPSPQILLRCYLLSMQSLLNHLEPSSLLWKNHCLQVKMMTYNKFSKLLILCNHISPIVYQYWSLYLPAITTPNKPQEWWSFNQPVNGRGLSKGNWGRTNKIDKDTAFEV